MTSIYCAKTTASRDENLNIYVLEFGAAYIRDFTVLITLGICCWLSVTWWHHTAKWIWSTLAQVMACCLPAPSHYLNQSWLIINGVLVVHLAASATVKQYLYVTLVALYFVIRVRKLFFFLCCLTSFNCHYNKIKWETSTLCNIWSIRYISTWSSRQRQALEVVALLNYLPSCPEQAEPWWRASIWRSHRKVVIKQCSYHNNIIDIQNRLPYSKVVYPAIIVLFSCLMEVNHGVRTGPDYPFR